MKTYLVTRGCGFIGSHLVETLINKGNKVIIVDDLSTGHISNINNFITNKKLIFVKVQF